MTTAKLEQKVTRYAEEEHVSLNESSFGRVCNLLRQAAAQSDNPQFESAASARLFAIVGETGTSSAVSALFKKQDQLNNLVQAPWKDIDWYAAHPWRTSISSMYSLKGFPDREAVEELEAWVRNNTDEKGQKNLFSSITGMQNGCGMPDLDDLNTLKKMVRG